MKKDQEKIRWGSFAYLVITLATVFFFCSGSLSAEETFPPQPEIRVGFVLSGPVGDGGFNYEQDRGRKEMEKLPYVKTTLIESVPEGDAMRIIVGLARQGYNLICTTSFGFMGDTAKAADKFPNVAFENCAGFLLRKNMGNYIPKMWNTDHLTGMLAGEMTKKGTVGIVAAHPVPNILRSVNAIALGVKKTNPQASTHLVFVNSWYDPGAESEAAESLINIGADVLLQVIDSPATQQIAEKHGVYSIGVYSDMRKFAPNANLTSVLWNMGVYYTYFAKQLHDGKWKSESLFWGLKEGAVDLAPFNPVVPPEVQKRIMETKQKIIEGDITVMPFYGPVRDQEGKIRVPAGEYATHKQLMRMDFLVDAIIGSISK